MMRQSAPAFSIARLGLMALLALLFLAVYPVPEGLAQEEQGDSGESTEVDLSEESGIADNANGDSSKEKSGNLKTAPSDATARIGQGKKTPGTRGDGAGKAVRRAGRNSNTSSVNTAEGQLDRSRLLAQLVDSKESESGPRRSPPPLDESNTTPLTDTTVQKVPGFIPDGTAEDPQREQGGNGDVDSARDSGRGRGSFGEEDLLKLLEPETGTEEGLPEFAQEQPGKIQEQPGMVLAQPETPVNVFESLLGPSMLPEADAESDIARNAEDPSREVPSNYARVVVPTGRITGSTEKKQFHIEGGLLIYYNEVVISADSADIDERNEVAHLFGNVKIDDPQYVLQTDDLLINFEEKRFQASGFVQFKKNAKANASQPDLSKDKKGRVRDYFANQQFELYCKQLFYNWESKELSAIEGVRLVHPSFNGTLERLDYNDKTKVYAMSGDVVLEVSNYEWVFVNKLVEGDDEKKARALTDSPTKINADRVLYSEESGLAQFYTLPGATVDFIQAKRSIKGVYIEVNDKTKDFYVEGDASQRAVYEQQDGNWLIQGGLIKEDQVSEDLKEALLKQLTAEAGSITYNFDRKRMELRDGVRIATETQTIEAGEVIQDETAKFFLMRGNVVIKPDAEGYIYAAQIYMDTENDVFTFVGLVDGKIKSDEIPDLMAQDQASAEAGANLGGIGQSGGPAQGIFQSTGGVTFQPSNRSTSAAKEKLRRLSSRSRSAEEAQEATALNGPVDRQSRPAGTVAEPGDPAQKGLDTEESAAAEKQRNGDTNVAEKD